MIPRFWPLQAAPDRQTNDIRKFEAIGTHPWALRAALGEALAFHQAIGAERKAARLRYLTLRWANSLKSEPKIKILSNLGEPAETWGVAMVGIDGIPAPALSRFMMDKYRIVINAVVGGSYPNQVFDYEGLRVTPNVYTTTEEIDTFVTAMLDAVKNGVPPVAVGDRAVELDRLAALDEPGEDV
jgi:selenocysteine lyase/cysteine desulfurase